jgi:hypothetical protein
MLSRPEEQCCVGLPQGAALKSTWSANCCVCSRALMSNQEFEYGICVSRRNLDACLCARKGSDCHGGDRQPDPCVPVSRCRHRQILSLIVPYLPNRGLFIGGDRARPSWPWLVRPGWSRTRTDRFGTLACLFKLRGLRGLRRPVVPTPPPQFAPAPRRC